MQTAVGAVVKDIREEVAELVAAARDSGCRFVVQGDTWRTRRGGHYLAVLLSWGDVNFSIQEVCAWVGVVEAPRTGEVYAAAFQKALEHVGLTTKDVLAGFSGHEGAVRKGLCLLSVPVVGCKTAAACLDNRPLVETTAARKRAPKQRRCVVDDSSTGALVAAGEQVEPAPKRRRLAERPSGEDFLFPLGVVSCPQPAVAALDAFPLKATMGNSATAWWRKHAWWRDANAATLIFGHANVRRGWTGALRRSRKAGGTSLSSGFPVDLHDPQ